MLRITLHETDSELNDKLLKGLDTVHPAIVTFNCPSGAVMKGVYDHMTSGKIKQSFSITFRGSTKFNLFEILFHHQEVE